MRILMWWWICGLLMPGIVLADARTEVLQAFAKTFAPGVGLRAEQRLEAEGRVEHMSTEMVLPDRFRTRNDKGVFVILPQGSWMQAAGSSEWRRFELNPASANAAYSEEGLRKLKESMRELEALPDELLDGRLMQRFQWQAQIEYLGVKSQNRQSAWVDPETGRIVRLDSHTTTNGLSSLSQIRYQVLEGLQIEAPL